MQLLSKLTGTRLLILGGILVAIAALIETSRLLRNRTHRAPTPALIEDVYVPVLPPNLARDPFLSATPKPPAIVAPRPNVRREAALAAIAIGAYLAVFAMSALGGDRAPDLLSIRGNGNTAAPALASDVLGAQSATEPVVTETVVASAAFVPDPTPASTPVPTPEPTPERPTQHVLRSGETLTSVAALYGTTAYDLAATNGLSGDLIYAGQVLRIPPR